MHKKILATAGLLSVVASIAGFATFSAFSSTTANSGNSMHRDTDSPGFLLLTEYIAEPESLSLM
jgi:hypothetical protein